MCVRLRMLSLLLLIFSCFSPGRAALGETRCIDASSAAPCIDKIDPPGWWVKLPSPMLLLYGDHLGAAQVAATGKGVAVVRTRASANGHHLFVWLDTKSAAPQTISLRVTTSAGSVFASFTLSARTAEAEGFQGFSERDVMYLIMPDRFADGDRANDHLSNFRVPDDRSLARSYHGGDLRGIQDHLDYLKQLGVTTLWTTPLYDNSAGKSGQTYHGYSATDMYAVDPHFGTMADYRALVAAAHARGMKVVLDMVPNHVGPAHPWAIDQPTPDWLHGTPASHIKVDDDFASVTDPAAGAARRRVLLDGWFADVLPDLNQNNPLVVQYLIQNTIWWIQSARLDGLRIDTFPYVPRSFWHEYNKELHALYPRMRDVGEIFNSDPHITSFFAGGQANRGSDGTYDTLLDTPFDYPMFFALRGSLTHHKPMSAIADVLREDKLYPHPERLVTFLGNHDTKRFLSEPGANLAALHLAFGLLATLRGMPQLYYGDEIAMTGGGDPDNRKDFPGGFPNDKSNAFTDAGRSKTQEAMHAWVETLMQLRQHTPALQTGKLQLLLAEKDSLAFVRTPDLAGNCTTAPAVERYLIVVNNNPNPQDVILTTDVNTVRGCTHYKSILQDGAAPQIVAGKLHVYLPGQEIGIFRAQP